MGLRSGSYTYVSDVYDTKRWLDHCVVSEAGWKAIINVKIHYNVYWSDHFPLSIECNLDLMGHKYICNRNDLDNVTWGERNSHEIQLYRELCNQALRDVDFPVEFRDCCDKLCSNFDHRIVINEMYDKIINILRSAAKHSCKKSSLKRKKHVVGWNKHVKKSHGEARLAFQNWIFHGRPRSGRAFDSMVSTRQEFKKKIMWCQNNAKK